MQPTIENINKEIFMLRKYALTGLLLIKKTTLKDILLCNKYNQYFYSLFKKHGPILILKKLIKLLSVFIILRLFQTKILFYITI